MPFRGIEIDKCSGCAGVWLDTHELERIVEEEGGFASALRRVFG
jgi:Zn-finger nucleic acid-binding protein